MGGELYKGVVGPQDRGDLDGCCACGCQPYLGHLERNKRVHFWNTQLANTSLCDEAALTSALSHKEPLIHLFLEAQP